MIGTKFKNTSNPSVERERNHGLSPSLLPPTHSDTQEDKKKKKRNTEKKMPTMILINPLVPHLPPLPHHRTLLNMIGLRSLPLLLPFLLLPPLQ